MSSSKPATPDTADGDVGVVGSTSATTTTGTATTPSSSSLSFLAFTSTVESPFWVKYCKLKLETIQLSQEPIQITATYSVASPRLQLIESSLPDDPRQDTVTASSSTTGSTSSTTATTIPNNQILARGQLIGFNTLEAFSKCDKNALLSQMTTNSITTTTSSMSSSKSKQPPSVDFVLITFADLKQHTIVYWFGLFPVCLGPNQSYPWHIRSTTPSTQVAMNLPHQLHQWRILQEQQRQQQASTCTSTTIDPTTMPHSTTRVGLAPYFVATADQIFPLWHDSPSMDNTDDDNDDAVRRLLADNNNNNNNNDDDTPLIFVVMDTAPAPTSTTTSTSQQEPIVVGWPLRRLIAKLVLEYHWGGKPVTICCWRALVRRIELTTATDPTMTTTTSTTLGLSDQEVNEIHRQLVWIQIDKLPMPDQYSTASSSSSTLTLPKVVGWEWNATKKKPAPRRINLQPLLDPSHLAIQAADLNLKLMKWRMLPALDVPLLQQQKVLLLGAGTLGCSVARTLLGWGVRNLTLLDYGTVSYSNPVRQNLFTLDDCHGTGKPKAQAAVDALQQIAADLVAQAIRLSIPMPGHGESKESIVEAVTVLDQLVRDADVIYLLTDTRESRWLPTLMAAAHDKILLNAALGLDSWLVIRHGGGSGGGGGGKRLGCYFCNDVVAPENSTKNRTLDQQCTVTRPGLAPIAASMAVELMVALLHHPLKQRAPAPTVVTGNASYNPTASTEDESSSAGALGIMPHQIRGSLVSYQMMTPTVPAFGCCTGCSPRLIEAYHANKMELVYEVCQSPDGSYLEDLTGLTAFRAEAAEKLAAMEDDDDLWDDE